MIENEDWKTTKTKRLNRRQLMKAVIPTYRNAPTLGAAALSEEMGAAQRLLAPLFTLAETSDWLIAGAVGEFEVGEKLFHIPRFIFMGPKGGGDTIRLAIFAALDGRHPEGPEAVVELLRDLDQNPAPARGFHIYVYPICNPSGFEAATRQNARGQDLATHFWRGSNEPEVYYLERELGVHRFAGVISLHTGNHHPTQHFHARTRYSILSEALLRPALDAAHQFILPERDEHWTDANPNPTVAKSMAADFLTRTEELKPVPFEINIEIPGLAPKVSQIRGTVAALTSILDSYRTLMATQQNI
jgi:hypothetical protein